MKSSLVLLVSVTGVTVLIAALLIGFSDAGRNAADDPSGGNTAGDPSSGMTLDNPPGGDVALALQKENERLRKELAAREKHIRELEGKIAELVAARAVVPESQEAMRECGIRDPVTNLPIEKLAQAKLVFTRLEEEAKAASAVRFEEELKNFTADDFAAGKYPQSQEQSADEWRAQRDRAYGALCLLWGKERASEYLFKLRAFWASRVGDGVNALLVAQLAMEYPDIAQAIRIFGVR